MSAEPFLVDTNVLLEVTDERRRYHAEALGLLESPARLVLSAQIIREYLAVATRPEAANGLGMSMADALANVREFRRTIRLLPEEKPILPTFLALLEAASCTGKRVHDAHLVATAMVHRVGIIVSLNPTDLIGVSRDVKVVSPAQALRELREAAAPRRRRASARARPMPPSGSRAGPRR